MKTGVLCVLAASVAAMTFAAPTVLTATASIDNGKVTGSYTLDKPAVVTVGVETNAGEDVWVALPGTLVKTLSGDVNRYITDTGTRTFVWNARRDWPNVMLSAGMVRLVVKAWDRNAPPKWMAVDLTASSDAARFYDGDDALPVPPTDAKWKTTSILMRRIPAAFVEWRMGREAISIHYDLDPSGWDWTKETPHMVTLTKDYYMAIYETTQRQYVLLTGRDNPSQFKNACEECGDEGDLVWMRPVDKVTYSAVTGSGGPIDVLKTKTGNDTFNLPTTAEWEYACRGGSAHNLYNGYDIRVQYTVTDEINKIAWVGRYGESDAKEGNSHGHSHPVGMKEPNGFGLYDTLGNVEEFTRDWHQIDVGTADAIDPEYPTQGAHGYHATCGGNWGRPAQRCRPCCQNGYENGANICGFRVYCR